MLNRQPRPMPYCEGTIVYVSDSGESMEIVRVLVRAGASRYGSFDELYPCKKPFYLELRLPVGTRDRVAETQTLTATEKGLLKDQMFTLGLGSELQFQAERKEEIGLQGGLKVFAGVARWSSLRSISMSRKQGCSESVKGDEFAGDLAIGSQLADVPELIEVEIA